MTNDHAGMPGRFVGNWKRALGELAIVALGVLLALWADQAMQAREEVTRATGYLERLQEDVRADVRSLRFSRDQARRRLEITRQVADCYNQIGLQIDQWSAWGDVGITETYFREVAFVVDPELRLRAGTFDPALMRRFLSASGEHGPSNNAEVRGTAAEIGATRADADRILERMRTRLGHPVANSGSAVTSSTPDRSSRSRRKGVCAHCGSFSYPGEETFNTTFPMVFPLCSRRIASSA